LALISASERTAIHGRFQRLRMTHSGTTIDDIGSSVSSNRQGGKDRRRR
jgi:hypothetical protein